MLTRVYWSRGQAEVYRAQMKMVRRKKGESLTDLVQEIRRLMVLAFPGVADRTTDVVARDVFIESLEDLELVIQVQAQHPADLDTALRVAQHMEAVMKSLLNKSSKPIRMVVLGTTDSRVRRNCGSLRLDRNICWTCCSSLCAPNQSAVLRSLAHGSDPPRWQSN